MMTDKIRVRYGVPTAGAEELARFAADLARKYEISATALLVRVLVKALVDPFMYEGGGGTARAGESTAAVSGDTVAARDRILDLVGQLDDELAEATWPLNEAQGLRQALDSYRQRLRSIAWATRSDRTTKKPRMPEGVLALILAEGWWSLTGEVPKAWRRASDGSIAGRFYEFVVDVCAAFRRQPPKLDTVRAVLRHCGYIKSRFIQGSD